ncbi:hypothetical protein Lal_00047936 [Lupinus albus]|nr:hypothetical protein Lal_00047936 [Lupinus albus]
MAQQQRLRPEEKDKRSNRREPRPEPVPPPTALKTKKPWRPVLKASSPPPTVLSLGICPSG